MNQDIITEETPSCEAQQENPPSEVSDVSQSDGYEALLSETSESSAELEKRKAEAKERERQLKELYELFPNCDAGALPESVWQSAREGNSLAASYALYVCRAKKRENEIKNVNRKNASLSAGYAGDAARGEYFTPDEVRAMSQSEVRANYNKIIASMKKWN